MPETRGIAMMSNFSCSTWSSGGIPAWVAGFRSPATIDETGQDWRLVLAAWLDGRRSSLPRNPDGHSAERALGLSESDYWFIGRARRHFGSEIVALWDAHAPDHDARGGACPFDSGCLGNGWFVLRPGASASAMFAKYDRELAEWRASFLDHVRSSYLRAEEYVEGRQPRVPIAEIVGIVPAPPIDEQSQWTWEARIERTDRGRDKPWLVPVVVIIKEDYLSLFTTWLGSDDCPLDEETAVRVMKRLQAAKLPCRGAAWSETNAMLGRATR